MVYLYYILYIFNLIFMKKTTPILLLTTLTLALTLSSCGAKTDKGITTEESDISGEMLAPPEEDSANPLSKEKTPE